LFENSFKAGRTGNQQWGLDARSHQDDWSPYADIPTHWNHGDLKLNLSTSRTGRATMDRSSRTKMSRCQTRPRELVKDTQADNCHQAELGLNHKLRYIYLVHTSDF
ncbi:hypothetical protein B0H17DRAFT_940511, partial [Mycena rosella]